MRILYLFTFLIFINLGAQSSTNAVITYQESKKDFLGTHKAISDLYFNNKHSVYFYNENENKHLMEYKSTGKFAEF